MSIVPGWLRALLPHVVSAAVRHQSADTALHTGQEGLPRLHTQQPGHVRRQTEKGSYDHVSCPAPASRIQHNKKYIHFSNI